MELRFRDSMAYRLVCVQLLGLRLSNALISLIARLPTHLIQ